MNIYWIILLDYIIIRLHLILKQLNLVVLFVCVYMFMSSALLIFRNLSSHCLIRSFKIVMILILVCFKKRRFPRKLEIDLPEDPAKPLLGIYPKDSPSCQRGMCSTMFISALFVIARSFKQPRCPMTEEWIQKMCFIYTMDYYSAIKNNGFMKFPSKWMDLENIALSEVTQSKRNTLTDKWILGKEYGLLTLQLTDHMELKRK